MALAPYARQVARVAMQTVLRWPDMPSGAVRQVTLDVADWADQVTGDPPTSVAVAITPDAAGLVASGEDTDGDVLGLTLIASSGGIGTDFLVLLTATTAGGRIEPFPVRILVTDPGA